MDALQYDLPLIDPTEPRILPQDGTVWFAVCRYSDDRMRQHCYRLALIEPILRTLRRAIDTYLSQGTFAVPTRRSVHVAWLTHAYVDLDAYKSARWRGLSPDDMIREIIWHCADAGIPPPSIILSSGRGYYCKWFWSQPVPRAEAGRALAINRALCRALAVFHADPNACDLSRILRVVGTINGKNDRPVEILWLSGPPGDPTTYNFDAFAHDLARPVIDDMQAEAGEPPRCYFPELGLRASRRILDWGERQYAFSREHWHWGVLEDIRTLAIAVASCSPACATCSVIWRPARSPVSSSRVRCSMRSSRPAANSCRAATSAATNSAAIARPCCVARRTPPRARWWNSKADSRRRSTPTARTGSSRRCGSHQPRCVG